MSAWERRANTAELADWREQARQAIYNGAIGERNQAIEGYQAARQKLEAARANEERRWDAGKLGAEVRLARDQVADALANRGNNPLTGGPGAGERLAELYQAAKRGDEYRQRAMAEVMRYAQPPDGARDGEQLAVTRLARQAAADYAGLRRTPEMTAASEAVTAARSDLSTKQEQLKFAAGALGEQIPDSGPFITGGLAKAYRQVAFEPNGDVKIYDKNAPEVTGIFLPEQPAAEGG
jgi:hypothetical protein